jgi:glycosyltransferase involved in cell wall biosynthesis
MEKSSLLLISPYHGGSHQAWAEGYRKNSRHTVNLLTMPDRFWKWRMHGGAITLSREFLASRLQPDCLLATDMLDLTTFLSLTRNITADTPAFLYMHENQLTYPLPDGSADGPMRRQGGERDLHYGFINLVSMLAARQIFFNSEYHRQSLFGALPDFLKHFPDYNELTLIPHLEEKSRVLPVGVDLQRLRIINNPREGNADPLIIWNHRWEYDKDPSRFFAALYEVHDMGIPFRLAVCGRNFRNQPAEFEIALDRLSSHIIQYGYAELELYKRLLWDADISLSTARHEFFGVSTVEAIYCRTFPILPYELSYPEIIPVEYHPICLYRDDEEMISRLTWALQHRVEIRRIAETLSQEMARYDWSKLALIYDIALDFHNRDLPRIQ